MKRSLERCTSVKFSRLLPLFIWILAVIMPVSVRGNVSADSDPAFIVETEEVVTPFVGAAHKVEFETMTLPAGGRTAGQVLSIEGLVSSFEAESVEIPEYAGLPFAVVNNNIPFFTKSGLPAVSFEYYSELDALGRCGIACANIGQDIMPTEERGNIGAVKPTGWQTVKYDHVEGNYLYNRCHLIGYQLSAENANEKNLITGTRYLNTTGMLPFENMAADYVKETGNHVLYRVTPVFEENNLLAYGVLMEGWSVEDGGSGICFNVFAYNVQPAVVIDYATGGSYLDENALAALNAASAALESASDMSKSIPIGTDYILNTNKRSKKFHYPTCSSVGQMDEKNKQAYHGSRDDIIAIGYTPCKNCNP